MTPQESAPVMSQAQLNDAEQLRCLRETAPVHHVNVGGWHRSWILTGYDVSVDVLSDPRLNSDADGEGSLPDAGAELLSEEELVNLPGPQHARLRRLIGRQLTPRRVDALGPRIQAEIDRLLAALDPHQVVDFVEAVALPLPAVVLCELFDVPEEGRRHVYHYVPGLAGVSEELLALPAEERRRVTMVAIADYLTGLVRQRRAAPGDDLLSAMIRTPGDAPTELELLSAVRLVLVSGHRAVTALIANGLVVLLREPRLWQRLVAEPALIDSAVEELLRYVTPIALSVPRQVSCPVSVGDVVVPEGEIIQAAWGAANRDPAAFPDPDTVDLERRHNNHLSFGQGHHYCPGAALGRLEATLLLRTLVARFPRLRLASDGPLAYRSGSVRELVRLPIVLDPS